MCVRHYFKLCLRYTKIMKTIAILLVFMIPALSHAQEPSLQNFFKNFLTFTYEVLLPFVLGLAFLLFVINATRFFIIEGSNEDGRKKARALAVYSVAAFFLLIVFWGIVGLLVESLGLPNSGPVCPDYLKLQGGCDALPDPDCVDPGFGGAC